MHFQNSCSRRPDSRGMLCNYLFIDRVSSVASHWCQGDLALRFLWLSYDKQDTLVKFFILSVITVLSFFTYFFGVLRFENVIHKFHLYFNYWTTLFLVEEGFYHFCNLFGGQDWYYLEQVIGETVYLGLNDYLCCKLPCTSSYPHYI